MRRRPPVRLPLPILLTAPVLILYYVWLRGEGRGAGYQTPTFSPPAIPPVPPPCELRKLGNCFYTATRLCVEGGKVILPSCPRDDEVDVPLCTGYPQRKPEGTKMRLVKAVQAPEAPVDPTPALFIVTTLETNLFHVIRDTLANVVDMVEELRVATPLRIVLLPKHPMLTSHSSAAYHLVFAGLVAEPWEDHVTKVEDLSARCFSTAYVGQPFRGYHNGPPGRLRRHADATLRALHIEVPQGTQKRLLMIDRGGVNRKVGNAKEILEMAKGMGFDTARQVMQDLPVLEQLKVAARSDVLMGSHGQALSWCTFLRKGSVCFELGIWKDVRPDYKLLAKWVNVEHVFIPLPNPSQVRFHPEDLGDKEKGAIDYYHPFSNYHYRQHQIIYPDLAEVRRELLRFAPRT